MRERIWNRRRRFHVGLRTIKTAAAIIVSMVIVDQYGSSASKLIFAMLGAMSVVQPTFKASVEACLSQILGVICGALAGVLFLQLPISHLTAIWIGVILIITAYNSLHITISPSLPCFILVMVCTTPDIVPLQYAAGRIWDTAIGLGVGMVINVLVFPYDNSRKIRDTIESLDRDLIAFLEDMFDGDDILPDADKISGTISRLEMQLTIFATRSTCSMESAAASSWSDSSSATGRPRSWSTSWGSWAAWSGPAGSMRKTAAVWRPAGPRSWTTGPWIR